MHNIFVSIHHPQGEWGNS